MHRRQVRSVTIEGGTTPPLRPLGSTADDAERELSVGILLIWQFSVYIGMETPDANESSKYLDAVRTFADKPEILFRVKENC